MIRPHIRLLRAVNTERRIQRRLRKHARMVACFNFILRITINTQKWSRNLRAPSFRDKMLPVIRVTPRRTPCHSFR